MRCGLEEHHAGLAFAGRFGACGLSAFHPTGRHSLRCGHGCLHTTERALWRCGLELLTHWVGHCWSLRGLRPIRVSHYRWLVSLAVILVADFTRLKAFLLSLVSLQLAAHKLSRLLAVLLLRVSFHWHFQAITFLALCCADFLLGSPFALVCDLRATESYHLLTFIPTLPARHPDAAGSRPSLAPCVTDGLCLPAAARDKAGMSP